MTRQYLKYVKCLSFLSAFFIFLGSGQSAEPVPPTFKMGFMTSMFTAVNENDAKVAVNVWGNSIIKSRNSNLKTETYTFKNTDEMLRALQAKEVDAVSISMIEFDLFRLKVAFDPVFVTSQAGQITEQYILLAHSESSVKNLDSLRGKTLILHQHIRTCLAPLWIDTLLIQQGHKSIAKDFVGTIKWDTRLTNVVLPVFFRKVDACIVSRDSFDTMVELNPQLAKQLTVIAESPAMVSVIFAFRADYNPSVKDELVSGINDLKKSPAGRQILTIFESDDIGVQPLSSMKSAFELIETHKRLVEENKRP